MPQKKYTAEAFDIKWLNIQAFGYVAPPFPAGFLKSTQGEKQYVGDDFEEVDTVAFNEATKTTLIGTEMLMPLSIGIPNQKIWELPTEPMIAIKGGQKIIRRYPNRSTKGGSIKERWSSDDYKLTIKGVLLNFSENKYPEKAVKKLRQICEHKGNLKVENTLFRIFGIERIVIEKYDIPFTSGLAQQSFIINAYSDQLFNALLTES